MVSKTADVGSNLRIKKCYKSTILYTKVNVPLYLNIKIVQKNVPNCLIKILLNKLILTNFNWNITTFLFGTSWLKLDKFDIIYLCLYNTSKMLFRGMM